MSSLMYDSRDEHVVEWMPMKTVTVSDFWKVKIYLVVRKLMVQLPDGK